jgi:hypothetical protein
MMAGFEEHIQKRNTLAYLDADAEWVTLSRNAMPAADGSGGYTAGGTTPLDPQEFVLTTTNRQLPIRRTVDGLEVSPEYIMTGRWDADIQAGDWFFRNGVKFEVVFVHLDRSYETTAEVMYRG